MRSIKVPNSLGYYIEYRNSVPWTHMYLIDRDIGAKLPFLCRMRPSAI